MRRMRQARGLGENKNGNLGYGILTLAWLLAWMLARSLAYLTKSNLEEGKEEKGCAEGK